MAPHLNGYSIDVPSVDVAIYDIEPQPTTPAWNRLDTLEGNVSDKTSGVAVRHHDGESWKIIAFGPKREPPSINVSNGSVSLVESTTWDNANWEPKVVSKALEKGLKSFLTNHRGYWDAGSNRVYQYEPFESEGGFNRHLGYKIAVEHSEEFLLFIDPCFKFLAARSLKGWISNLGVDTVRESFAGDKFIMFSKRTSSATLESIYEDKTVEDEELYGKSIYQHNRESPAPQSKDVERTDPLCSVKYPNNPKEYTVSPALLFKTPGNSDALNETAIISPKERHELIRELAFAVSFIQLGSERFSVFDEEVSSGITQFGYPSLEFGDGFIFDPSSFGELPSKWEWEKEMKRLLKENGPAKQLRGERRIAFSHPKNYSEPPEKTYEEIHDNLQRFGKVHAPGPKGIVEHTDRTVWNEWTQQQGESVDGVLCALAGESDDRYYSLVNDVKGIPVQHLTPSALNEHRNGSLFNVSMGLAAKLGLRPFLLTEPLCADLVIGFDVNGVKRSSVGAVTIDGKSGNVITHTTEGFGAGNSSSASTFATESALRSQIETAVHKNGNAGSILIHRGGILKNDEEAAIRSLMRELVDDGTLSDDLRWGVVEVSSDSAHRIFDPDNGLKAKTGASARINDETAVVVNGGAPYVFQGTPRATCCTLAASNCDWDINAIAQDVFRLSFLNWGSPGSVNMRSPISTKLSTKLAKMFEKCNQVRYLPF